jgi:hypothetical protein
MIAEAGMEGRFPFFKSLVDPQLVDHRDLALEVAALWRA